MNRLLLSAVFATGLLAQASAHAAGVRDHTRLAGPGAAVSQSQAEELTLTLSETAVRPVQTWVRAAATLQAGAGNTLLADLPLSEAALVRIGQRVRAFPLESRSSMYPGENCRRFLAGRQSCHQSVAAGAGARVRIGLPDGNRGGSGAFSVDPQ